MEALDNMVMSKASPTEQERQVHLEQEQQVHLEQEQQVHLELELEQQVHLELELEQQVYSELRLEIQVKGKTGYRIATTTKDAPAFYRHLQKLHPDHKADDFVFFPNYTNRTTAKQILNRQFNRVLDRAGLKKTSDGRSAPPCR